MKMLFKKKSFIKAAPTCAMHGKESKQQQQWRL
jgi:hypothetical protein